MPIDERDLAFLVDIYDNCRDILEYTKDIKYIHFERDKMRRKAVERSLEIIGQASNKISKETRDALPNIPWAKIVGLRNKIAHEYGEILIEIIWFISHNSVPVLMREISSVDELKEYINIQD